MSGKQTGPAGKRASNNGGNAVEAEKHEKLLRASNVRYPKTDLEQAIQRYKDLFDFAPIGYVTFNRFGRIEEVNFAAVRLLGRSRKQLIGSTFAVCVAKKDTQLFLHHMLECHSSDRPVITELQLQRPDGERVIVQLSSTPSSALMKDGARLYQTAIVDLTPLKSTEAALRKNEAELELIVTQTPFMLTRCSRDLRYRYVSRPYAQMLDRTPEELAGKPLVKGLGKKGLAIIRPYVDRVLSGESVAYEANVPFPNGQQHFLRAVYLPDRDAQGKVIGWIASILDITEQKRREMETLRLAAIVQSSRDAIVAKDLNGIIGEWNKSAERIFGYTRKEIVGKSILTLIPEERRGEEEHILNEIRRGRSVDHYETVRRRKDGTLIHVSLTISPIKDRNGKIIGVSKIARDITSRKQAEERLREQARLLDLSSDAILVRDAFDRIVYWNHGAKQIYGYSGEEAMGKVTHKLLRTEHSEPLKNIYRKLHRDNRWSGELVHTCKDGTKITVSSRWALDRDADGKPAFILETNNNITERKRASEKLRESEERLRAIVNQSNAGMANCDLNGKILFANRKLCKMLGYTERELALKTIFAITHPDDIDVTRRRFEQMVRRRQPVELEKRYIRKDGTFIWASVCDTPVLDTGGNPFSAVAVAIDITRRKKAEAALQESKGLLEQLVRQRTEELIAANTELKGEIERRKGLEGEILSISDREQQRLGQELHDGLCQHLTAVAFMARSIAMRLKNHRVIEVSDIDKIAQLVNDAASNTRDLSRALHRLDVDSAGLVDALRDLVDREIWRTPCRLEVSPSFRIENDVAAAHIYRIAREAVINANKHAQAREIVVKLERSRQGAVLRVIDDGVGCNNVPKLKPGLGLHIMNYRAQLVGGRLEIDSPKQGGTCVSCYLSNNTRRRPKPHKQEKALTRRFHAKIATALATLI